ncbi:hypothetical protein JCM9279_004787 [Rhodotorula babjevae]
MAAHASPIPIIDLTTALSVDELGEQVLKAASTIGFLFLRLPQDGKLRQESVNGMFAIAKELFDGPLEDRQACSNDDDRNGYIGYRRNRLAESAGAGDLKENFTYGRHPEHLAETRQPLPPSLRAHRDELDDFHGACWDLTCQLLDAFSVALKGCNGLTLINYPAILPGRAAAEAAAAATSRASEHKDWVRTWHAAPVLPGTVLVNLGLAVEAWTSGVLRATLHRVIVQPDADGGFRARRSMPYFVQPRDQVVLNPIKMDGTVDESERAVTSVEFFRQRIGASFRATQAHEAAAIAASS